MQILYVIGGVLVGIGSTGFMPIEQGWAVDLTVGAAVLITAFAFDVNRKISP